MKEMVKIKEVPFIQYLFLGLGTIACNVLFYILISKILNWHMLVAMFLAWILAMIWNYYMIRVFIIRSNKWQLKEVIKSFTNFLSFRHLSLMFDMFLFLILVELVNLSDIKAKIIGIAIVILLDYVYMELLIFKNREVLK